jgi:hypothetical protein
VSFDGESGRTNGTPIGSSPSISFQLHRTAE